MLLTLNVQLVSRSHVSGYIVVTEDMLCLCHCNADFVHFNIYSPFTVLVKFGWLVGISKQ